MMMVSSNTLATHIFLCLQLSSLFAASVWSAQEGDWVKVVDSALMFLSGSSGGVVNLGSFLILFIIT